MNNPNEVLQLVRALAPAIGAWGEYNFDHHAPHYGVAEEAGELIHAKLKMAQGIRGTPEEHQLAIKDAYADLLVFLSHLHYKQNSALPIVATVESSDLAALYCAISLLLSNPHLTSTFDLIAGWLASMADRDGVDLVAALSETWAEVGQRDWRKFPRNGKDQ